MVSRNVRLTSSRDGLWASTVASDKQIGGVQLNSRAIRSRSGQPRRPHDADAAAIGGFHDF